MSGTYACAVTAGSRCRRARRGRLPEAVPGRPGSWLSFRLWLIGLHGEANDLAPSRINPHPFPVDETVVDARGIDDAGNTGLAEQNRRVAQFSAQLGDHGGKA